jgi:hypothetical protein
MRWYANNLLLLSVAAFERCFLESLPYDVRGLSGWDVPLRSGCVACGTIQARATSICPMLLRQKMVISTKRGQRRSWLAVRMLLMDPRHLDGRGSRSRLLRFILKVADVLG